MQSFEDNLNLLEIIFASSYSELDRRDDVGPVFFLSVLSGLPKLFRWR